MFLLQPAQLTEERKLVFPASSPSSTGIMKILYPNKTHLSSEELLITFRRLQRVFIGLPRLFAQIKHLCNVYCKFRRVIDNI
jgi:hypothetical protein